MDLNAKAREIVYHFILYTMTLPIEKRIEIYTKLYDYLLEVKN